MHTRRVMTCRCAAGTLSEAGRVTASGVGHDDSSVLLSQSSKQCAAKLRTEDADSSTPTPSAAAAAATPPAASHTARTHPAPRPPARPHTQHTHTLSLARTHAQTTPTPGVGDRWRSGRGHPSPGYHQVAAQPELPTSTNQSCHHSGRRRRCWLARTSTICSTSRTATRCWRRASPRSPACCSQSASWRHGTVSTEPILVTLLTSQASG